MVYRAGGSFTILTTKVQFFLRQFFMYRWVSGLNQRPAKAPTGQPVREFESLPVRHCYSKRERPVPR